MKPTVSPKPKPTKEKHKNRRVGSWEEDQGEWETDKGSTYGKYGKNTVHTCMKMS